MPELPEVETIRCQLERKLPGQKIQRVWLRPGARVYRDFPEREKLAELLKRKKIKRLGRRGKYLLFDFGKDLTLVLHLGMSGSLELRPKSAGSDRHCHLEIHFPGSKLVFRDPRMFGRVALIYGQDFSALPGLAGLGPEPLSPGFNQQWLSQKFSGRKTALKSLLLDQGIAAGLGNIYADEACHLARLSPLRPAGKLAPAEIKQLVKETKKVLETAIARIGCTFRDYRTAEGTRGDYQPLVYGREGQSCARCKGTIRRVRLGSRSSWYCPGCQF